MIDMNIALWTVQILLALLFLLTGGAKLSQPKAKLLERMHALENLTPMQIKLIGTAEILAVLGLILPQLTPLAAVGCALLMVGTTLTHVRRGESVVITAVVFLLSVFVAYGRFVPVPV